MGVLSSRMTMPLSIGHEGSLIYYGLHSHHISTQLNTYGRFWCGVLDSALYHHHPKASNEGNLLGEWCSPVEFTDFNANAH